MAASTAKARSLNELDCAAAAAALTSARVIGARPTLSRLDYKQLAHDVPPPYKLAHYSRRACVIRGCEAPTPRRMSNRFNSSSNKTGRRSEPAGDALEWRHHAMPRSGDRTPGGAGAGRVRASATC